MARANTGESRDGVRPRRDSASAAFRAARRLAAAALLMAAAGCGAPGQPPFGTAAQGSAAVFGGGSLTLAAPRGYCIDRSSLRRTDQGGFALMAHCGRIPPERLFGGGGPAVITATIGRADKDGSAPGADDLARLLPGAEVTGRRDDLLLPLVRLDRTRHGAAGASSSHWRGAFVYDGHLVALALYAPEGSANLGAQGALLLNELTRRTLAASAGSPTAGPPADAAVRPRPAARQSASAPPPPGGSGKRPLKERIAGLFH